MRRYPRMLLVCFVLFITTTYGAAAKEADFVNVVIDPQFQSSTGISTPSFKLEAPQYKPASATFPRMPIPTPPRIGGKPIVKCAPAAPVCQPAVCMPQRPCCILPIRRPGQFELATQVFWARLSGTVRWPAMAGGLPTTELDPAGDLGLPRNNTFLEYSGKYQFRPTWALYYSIMPIYMEGTANLPKTVYYGNWVFPAGTRVNTKWDYLYQRVGLMYQPIVTTSLQVGIFGSWMYNDQRFQVKSYVCGGTGATVNRTRNMVMSGIELQKCIRTLPNGATLSADHRVGLGFLDNTFGLDAQLSLRFSVPMGPGRFGYARGGYRVLNLSEDRNDLRLDASLEGGFAELGIIF